VGNHPTTGDYFHLSPIKNAKSQAHKFHHENKICHKGSFFAKLATIGSICYKIAQ